MDLIQHLLILEEASTIQIPLPPVKKQTKTASHITQIRQKAKADLKQAKKEVEAMILGEA